MNKLTTEKKRTSSSDLIKLIESNFLRDNILFKDRKSEVNVGDVVFVANNKRNKFVKLFLRQLWV